MPTSECQKLANKKYRDANREKLNEKVKVSRQKLRETSPEFRAKENSQSTKYREKLLRIKTEFSRLCEISA